MTDRQEERLVELLEQTGMLDSKSRCRIAAEELLANGVIVPPYKVGVKVYYANYNEFDNVFEGTLVSYSLDAAHLWFNCYYDCGLKIWHTIEEFGKTVFLTKEEAEKVLVTDTNVGSKKELGK